MNDTAKNYFVIFVLFLSAVVQAIAFQHYFLLLPWGESARRFIVRLLPILRGAPARPAASGVRGTDDSRGYAQGPRLAVSP